MSICDKYLEDLEKMINPEVEDELLLQWNAFLDGELEGGYFNPERNCSSKCSLEWPSFSVNSALDDYDKMLLQQYKNCASILEKGSGEMLGVRANFGTSIIPSLFGCELFIMEEKLNTLPACHPLEGGKDKIRELINAGIPDLNKGWGEKVFAMGHKFTEIGKQYSKIGQYVAIYHPDMQGPMDIAEMLWGSSLFLDIMDEPELVKDFLHLITETYIAFMRKWLSIIPEYRFKGKSVHWSLMHKGNIMLRDDSAMNFSPEIFTEFIRPFNQRLLKEFNGGCMHFCGRGDHFIQAAAEMDKLYNINMSQPEYNDMEKIFQNTVDRGIFILGLNKDTATDAISAGRNLHGKVYTDTLITGGAV